MTSDSGRWDRDGLLANPAFLSIWPALELCPPDHFPREVELTALARSRGIVSGGGVALRFVSGEDASPRIFERQYEVRIYREGEVPTRSDNFHDLFNALAWISFPATKAILNRLHYQFMMVPTGMPARGDSESMASSLAGARGTPRDVLTLFDESGVVVACCEPRLAALLSGFHWKALFWTHRAELERAMRFFLFGHAIHEKMLRPYKGLTAKALVFPVSAGFFTLPLASQLAQVDAWTTERFRQPGALNSTRVLAPVPVLGVPGWEAANQCEAFYDDRSVFRPGRSRSRIDGA